MGKSARAKYAGGKEKCKKCGTKDLLTPTHECRLCNPEGFYKIYKPIK
jgi:hypothetical protein